MYTVHPAYIERDDGACIPLDIENSDYAAFLRWKAEGNTPSQPPATTAGAPGAVTMRQARLALLSAGVLGDVTAAIDALQGQQGDAARIEWEFAATVERDSPIVAMLAAAVGLDGAALDDLFTAAAAL